MIRLALQNRPQKLGNVLWIMGAVSIEKDDDVPLNMRYGESDRRSLPLPSVNEDMRSGSLGNVWGTIMRSAIHDDHLIGEWLAGVHDLPDGLLLIEGRYDHAHLYRIPRGHTENLSQGRTRFAKTIAYTLRRCATLRLNQKLIFAQWGNLFKNF